MTTAKRRSVVREERMAKKTKANGKIPVNKLITCKEFKKGIPKSDDVFVFPLPFPMEVGTTSDGTPMIATHCCLRDLDGDGAVENCFCTISKEGQIMLFNLKDAINDQDYSGYKGKSRTREIVN